MEIKLKMEQHWRENNDKMCRICQKEKESFKHILSRCEAKGKQDLTIRKFLDKTSREIKLMKRIKERGRSRTANCIKKKKQRNPGRARTTQPKRNATNQRLTPQFIS